jgi:hypothetical protein
MERSSIRGYQVSDVNIPLLRKAVEWAEAEAAKPAELCEWNQSYYYIPTLEERDTKFAHDSTMQPEPDFDWVAEARKDLAPECGTCYCIAGYVASTVNGSFTYYNAEYIAKDALGLSSGQAADLFFGGNSIDHVRRIAEEIAGEKL